MQGRAFGDGTVPKPVGMSLPGMGEAGRPLRVERRRMSRAVRFLLMWGTPIAIGLFLGSVGCRSSHPTVASGAAGVTRAAQPSR